MTSMGNKMKYFYLPVCNSFQPKILNDQPCYEVDLNKFSDKSNIEREVKTGFNFIMDYNEDRQVIVNDFENNNIGEKDISLASSIVESDQNQNAFIYLDSVGKKKQLSNPEIQYWNFQNLLS